MARSTKKSAPKKIAKKPASSRKPAKKAVPKKVAARKTAAAKKKPTTARKPKPAKVTARKPDQMAKSSKSSRPSASVIRSANGKASKAGGKPNQTLTIIGNHVKPKERRLDPFTRAQKDKLLQLRDAMVDSMAGVAQDTLRARRRERGFGFRHAPGGCWKRRL